MEGCLFLWKFQAIIRHPEEIEGLIPISNEIEEGKSGPQKAQESEISD
jgi:hypothetical protein